MAAAAPVAPPTDHVYPLDVERAIVETIRVLQLCNEFRDLQDEKLFVDGRSTLHAGVFGVRCTRATMGPALMWLSKFDAVTRESHAAAICARIIRHAPVCMNGVRVALGVPERPGGQLPPISYAAIARLTAPSKRR